MLSGQTSLHTFADKFKQLDFILNAYEKTNPELINLLLMKNSNQKTVLQLAIDTESSRCVNLILEKISNLSMNNIHNVKENFGKLLEYNAFENYLALCFY